MKEKIPQQFRSSDGCVIVAIIDSKRWFRECTFNDLPDEIRNQILESIEKAENLKRMLD